ncbi:hypothetical protein TVAG_198730 [Trichomonas vaginalis G3]|uniref:LIM zinc-binding domain-containing protein n=1 Tax=Trichomonas vaginalis (strain ATCC PRA-98 / G3) TaxID=412133 RepID=A2DDQ8_TRIV3|nr:negative regulation of hippo signaling [Trichomonas vaginalis G3]EAY21434.1 hypothetical protein TVAG_198730 [Trichomonas vaginalis G3]KAI5490647.1 negative regulation of hippo signaling [Trichomonas vaginalis G3]|eukprot:XP_001582420.1 hypothetical protein [Trichomonas vaginalis G3]
MFRSRNSDDDSMELNDLETPTLSRCSPLRTQNQQIDNFISKYKTVTKKTRQCLECHPKDKLPSAILRVANMMYHLDCLKCSRCNNMIHPPCCYLSSMEPLRFLCERCVDEIQDALILCKVCNKVIRDENKAVQLSNSYAVHLDCLHCYMCNRNYTPKGNLNYSVMEVNNKQYCLCNECMKLISSGECPTNDISGRIPFEICQTKPLRCKFCNEFIKNGFYYVVDQQISCYNCHKLQKGK